MRLTAKLHANEGKGLNILEHVSRDETRYKRKRVMTVFHSVGLFLFGRSLGRLKRALKEITSNRCLSTSALFHLTLQVAMTELRPTMMVQVAVRLAAIALRLIAEILPNQVLSRQPEGAGDDLNHEPPSLPHDACLHPSSPSSTPCTASMARWSVCIAILALRQSPSFSNGGKIFVLKVTPGVVVKLFAGLSAV